MCSTNYDTLKLLKVWIMDNHFVIFSITHVTTSTAPDCTGLKTEWTSTIKTTTQFPVNPGTVVEVTCSDSEHVNKGSSSITCITGAIFAFSEEPICSLPGVYFALLS